MNSIILLISVLTFVCGDKLDRTYLPPNQAKTSGGSESFLQTPNYSGSSQNFRGNGASDRNTFGGTSNFRNQINSRPSNNFARGPTAEASFNTNDNVVIDSAGIDYPTRPQAAFERAAGILRQDSENNADSYSYTFETENGIYAEESGVAANGVEAQGGFSYTGDDGQVYSVRYTADQNGFVPQGDHLPTAPPIPEEILRALEQNAADEAAGIFDDGSYDARKYAGADDGSAANFNYGRSGSSNGNDNGFGSAGNAEKATHTAAYLPPFSRRADQGSSESQIRPRFRGQEAASPSPRYGPPSSLEDNGNGRFGARNRQPSFNAKSGYQY